MGLKTLPALPYKMESTTSMILSMWEREGGKERKSKCYSLVFFFLACSKWDSLQLINSLWQQTEFSTIVRVCSSCDVNLALWWSCTGTSTLCLQTQILNDLTNTSFSATDIGTELGGSIRNQLENDVNSAFSQITDVLNSKWCFWRDQMNSFRINLQFTYQYTC